MSKKKSADTLALNKDQQKKVSKQVKSIKKKIEDGVISIRTNRRQAKFNAEEKRGLVYIGHIPHGFFEEEMKKYFKQFGRVTNVKICRSRTTGNSKGYGYVEFAHPEVAKIAAETMNNYIMFKKRIVTEFVPYEKRPKHLFHGKSSNLLHTSVKSRRGKQKYSRNKTLDEKTVLKKRKNVLKKLSAKMKRLKELGIQCNIKPVGIDESILNEIKVENSEKKSSKEVYEADSDVEFKIPTTSRSKLKKLSTDRFKNYPSTKSIMSTQSDRAFLTKSLDSVKMLLSGRTFGEDQETQTQPVKNVKKEKDGKKRNTKGAVVKKERKRMQMNQETVKKIARELIRKRGNPLINLVSSSGNKKSKKSIKK